jgi:hypothetical protein
VLFVASSSSRKEEEEETTKRGGPHGRMSERGCVVESETVALEEWLIITTLRDSSFLASCGGEVGVGCSMWVVLSRTFLGTDKDKVSTKLRQNHGGF